MAEGFPLHASRALIVVIILWAFSSTMALAFRCSLPHPWEFTENCIDQVSGQFAEQRSCSDENGDLERSLQIHRSLQHHHRRRPHPPSLHSLLARPSLPLKTLEDRSSIRDKNNRHHSNCHPNTLFRHPRRIIRQNMGEHQFQHVGPVCSFRLSSSLCKPS